MIDASIKAAASFERSKPEYKNQFGKVFQDPRPDIDSDSLLWVIFLVEADKVNSKLSDELFGFRCVGVRLEKTATGYAMRPHIDESGNCGFKDWAEYRDQTQKYLRPFTDQIKWLLANLEKAVAAWQSASKNVVTNEKKEN